YVSLLILRSVPRVRAGGEADVGEEDNARRAHDASPTEVAELASGVRRNEWMPVGGLHEHETEADDEEHDRQLQKHDEVVEASRLLDADHEQRRHQADENDRRDVDHTVAEHVATGIADLPGREGNRLVRCWIDAERGPHQIVSAFDA